MPVFGNIELVRILDRNPLENSDERWLPGVINFLGFFFVDTLHDNRIDSPAG
jgi:hypothetical protein